MAPYRGGGVCSAPGSYGVKHLLAEQLIELAVGVLGIELPSAVTAALESLGKRLSRTQPGTLEFLMAKGILPFVDNHKALHSRTPLTDPLISNRLMIRSWIAPCGTMAGVG